MIRHHARVICTLLSPLTLCSVHGAWAGSLRTPAPRVEQDPIGGLKDVQ